MILPIKKIANIWLAVIIIATVFLSCSKDSHSVESQDSVQSPFSSFRDIPGLTVEEIQAIEVLREQTDSFIYGTTPNSESYIGGDGEIHGFTSLLCEWMTSLLGITFQPVIYTWGDLVKGLDIDEIDFTGELTPAEDRREKYFMTDAIAERSIKYFRIQDSSPFEEIVRLHPLRYAFLADTTTWRAVAASFLNLDYETIFVDDSSLVYDMLKSGEIDAFFNEGPGEYIFDVYSDVVSHSFVPLIIESVSLATHNKTFAPIISVIQKALSGGGRSYLSQLYNQGYIDYQKHKLNMRLSTEERMYLQNNSYIRLAAEYDSYPVSFYNTYKKKWQGIAFDVLNEVEKLTGLKVELANGPQTEWPKLLEILRSGEAIMITQLFRTDDRVGMYKWPKNIFVSDNFALLSKSEYPNLNLNDIMNTRVALRRETAYAELFYKWFPDHKHAFEYESHALAFEALVNGDVDVVMSDRKELLFLSNYSELPGYKVNLVFDRPAETTFGFNAEEDVLTGIIDKVLMIIDVDAISSNWIYKTYDYKAKVLEAQRPWFVGATSLSLIVLALILAMFLRIRNDEKRLIQHQKELETANHAKSSFLAAMSHEMRTPMNAILGVTEIQLQNKSLSSDIKDALDKIYSSGYLLMGVLNDLLDLSKIEAGKLELINEWYGTASLINDTINLNTARIGNKPIEFKLHVDEDMLLEMIGDVLRIKQVLHNLLSNAIQYTDSGVVNLSFAAEVIGTKSAPYVILTIIVSDTGQGMTEDQVKSMFDAYSRFNTKVNRFVEGTGLGMNIVQHLVKKMDGEISVNSIPGKGTEVTVHLTQGYATSARLGKELAENLRKFHFINISRLMELQIVREPMPYGKVLVVDDMETNIYVAKGFLLPYGLTIDTAFSGREAIEKINLGNVYDIIFMDHMMPEMNGIEAVQVIRASGYKHPIVALTATAVSGQAYIFMANGFDGFISKPIDIREMNASLNKFVRDRQAPEVVKAARAAYGAAVAANRDAPSVNPELAKIFINDAKKVIAVLQGYETFNSNNSDELQKYTINVHALKSALANIGETRLADLAKDLEQEGRNSNIAFITEKTPAFLTELQALLDKLKSDDAEHDIGDVTDLDKEYLYKNIQVIKDACVVYDKKAAKYALTELKQKTWSSEYSTLLDTISGLLLHSDFDEAADVCDAYLSKGRL
jgi:signal transduction histidine kinase/CheY-like chemotaxis protein/HPt (histidine-containing phosphotransfer) domain-containing protein